MSTATQRLEWRGALTSADMSKMLPINFEVPEGVTNLHVTLLYSPHIGQDQKLPHQVSVSLFDPNGPRCEMSRPTEVGVDIGLLRSSPGGTSGPISAGHWTALIQVHRVLTEQPVEYVLSIELSFAPAGGEAAAWPAPKTGGRGAGWYRGDLHSHTIHSDGSWDVPDLVGFWHRQGVDFMTLSDHNTISGLAQARSMGDPGFLVMGGIELSTFRGHALAIGVRQWLDWRREDGSELPMQEVARQVMAAGCLCIIAHPMDPGDPGCCGCRWEHYDMMPGNALTIEIWNGIWSPSNQEALTWFYHWINEGRRLTATSGTDLHEEPPPGARGAVNVVYADDLTEDAVIAAIRAGRSYVSGGPTLLLNVVTESGLEAMLGDTVPPEAAVAVVCWSGARAGDILRFNVNGRAYREQIVGAAGEMRWPLAAGQARWCNAELRDADDGLWAVTNPIYFDGA